MRRPAATAKRNIVLGALALTLALLPVPAQGACGSGGATGDVHESFAGSEYWARVPAGPGPWPLVIALHGDNGDPVSDGILGFWQAIQTQRGDFALLVPRTPSVSKSWWKMPDRPLNEAWLDDLLDEIEGRYAIDGQRVYLWGFSGGACFLGFYATKRQERIAGITAVGGGCYPASLPPVATTCLMPARLIVGESDFTLGDVNNTATFLSAYGNPVELSILPGVGHAYTDESGGPALDWMTSHAPSSCARASTCSAGAPAGDGGTTPPADGGDTPVPIADGGTQGDSDAGPGHDDGGTSSFPPSSGPPAGNAGCAIGAGARPVGPAWLLALLGLATAMRRRASKSVRLVLAGLVVILPSSAMAGRTARIAWEPEPIGKGSFGSVYRGTGAGGRKLVLKRIPEGRWAEREALVYEALGAHRAWPRYFGMVEHRGAPGLVLEHVGGRPLTKWKPARVGDAVRVAMMLLEQVGELHARGYLHQDIKLANVMLTRAGRAPQLKIIDFGVARGIDTPWAMSSGTSGFRAPEQTDWRGQPDRSTDVFAVGGVLLSLLTHARPVREVGEQVRGIVGLGLVEDRGLRAVLKKAMALDPQDRYPTADALRTALAPYAELTTAPRATPRR